MKKYNFESIDLVNKENQKKINSIKFKKVHKFIIKIQMKKRIFLSKIKYLMNKKNFKENKYFKNYFKGGK